MSTPTENSAHTPGPWAIGSSNEVFPDGEGGESFSEWLNIVGPDGKVICELPGHSQFARGTDLSKREEANARLIAAAPELLQTLQTITAHLIEYGEWDDGCFYYGGLSNTEMGTLAVLIQEQISKATKGTA